VVYGEKNREGIAGREGYNNNNNNNNNKSLFSSKHQNRISAQ
jgi:hypothetical protein